MEAGEYLQRGIERAANGELLAALADYDRFVALDARWEIPDSSHPSC